MTNFGVLTPIFVDLKTLFHRKNLERAFIIGGIRSITFLQLLRQNKCFNKIREKLLFQSIYLHFLRMAIIEISKTGIKMLNLLHHVHLKLFSLQEKLQMYIEYNIAPPQWAFGAKMTLYRRRCDVMTSHRR